VDSLSFIERICAYTSATGLPPMGVHRKLTDQVLVHLGVRCIACNGTGVQSREGRRGFCLTCHGFLWCLSAHEVVRLYQIGSAAFPELRSRAPHVQKAADRWYCGCAVPQTAPRYFGLEPLPEMVPVVPDRNALLVASVAWRNGGRSEYVWTRHVSANMCVLWERIPELLLDDGRPWTEVFAWASGGFSDPAVSARRLLREGWSHTNPAYEWLAAPRMTRYFGLTEHFTAAPDGLLSGRELQSLFFAAISVRTRETKQPRWTAAPKRPAQLQTTNIGSYAFGDKPANTRKPAPATPLLRYAHKEPTAEPVAEGRVLPFRRNANSTRITKPPGSRT
jgi:hypothetical protein